jgi:hypothetical protein
MSFIQLIEIATTRPDEVELLVAEWRAQTVGRSRGPTRHFHTGQRATEHLSPDRGVSFLRGCDSELPETASFAERLSKLSDGPMLFRNLDVRSVEEM